MTQPPTQADIGDRTLFPELTFPAYLAHAAASPPSEPVRAALAACALDYARLGAAAFTHWIDQRARLRPKLAALVGAASDEIALMPNTTRGITDVALCFRWRRGERVVLFRGEFPANVTPWQRAAKLHGLEIVFHDADAFRTAPEAALRRLEAELSVGVRMVAVSAVQFQTGLAMPLAAIGALCHRHGARLFVDGVQAVGAMPIDVRAQNIDYLAAGSHKWLMGLEGAGFLFMRAEHAEELDPIVAGWLSHEDGLRFLLEGRGHLRYDRPIRRTVDVLEGANLNTAGLAGLEASVDILLALGTDAIHAHCQRYLDALEPKLLALGLTSLRGVGSQRSNTLSLDAPPHIDPVALHRALVKSGVMCSLPDGLLRLAPHWPNGLHEIPFVVEKTAEALRSAERPRA